MSIDEFKTLQIGVYVTDSTKPVNNLVCSDFYVIKNFKNGRILLQALWNDGHIDSDQTPFWVHYNNIDFSQKMYASTFREKIAIG